MMMGGRHCPASQRVCTLGLWVREREGERDTQRLLPQHRGSTTAAPAQQNTTSKSPHRGRLSRCPAAACRPCNTYEHDMQIEPYDCITHKGGMHCGAPTEAGTQAGRRGMHHQQERGHTGAAYLRSCVIHSQAARRPTLLRTLLWAKARKELLQNDAVPTLSVLRHTHAQPMQRGRGEDSIRTKRVGA